MDLVIDSKKEEKYKIQYGADVYEVKYPSWKEAKNIEKKLKKLQEAEDNDKASDFIIDTLKSLGLDKKFFDLDGVKAHHILKIWSEINAIKK